MSTVAINVACHSLGENTGFGHAKYVLHTTKSIAVNWLPNTLNFAVLASGAEVCEAVAARVIQCGTRITRISTITRYPTRSRIIQRLSQEVNTFQVRVKELPKRTDVGVDGIGSGSCCGFV
jgi:hypothetical protein